jgi:hypothetical protein
VDGNLNLPVPSIKRLNQTGTAILSILPCSAICRDSLFLSILALKVGTTGWPSHVTCDIRNDMELNDAHTNKPKQINISKLVLLFQNQFKRDMKQFSLSPLR